MSSVLSSAKVTLSEIKHTYTLTSEGGTHALNNIVSVLLVDSQQY